jgi:peptidoglycan-associated lipoprotein
MIKQAFWIISVAALTMWLGGCTQTATTATTPAAAPAAQPEAPKPTEQAAQPQAPQPEAPKPAEQAAQPEAPKPAEQAAPAVPAQAPAVVVVAPGIELKIIYFDFDKYDIKPEFRDAIKYNARELNKNRTVKVTIEGHADERGTTEYNLALGERRAVAVQKALIAEGVEGARLKVVSYGEERPVDSGHDEAAWAKNRRGQFSM